MQPRPKVTICGSFKRAPQQLAELFLELETTGCRVLSPLSLNFTNQKEPFVKLSSEVDFSILEIEKFHLRAIAESDFIWLHCPDGYIGLSGAFELGYALALHKPIYSNATPTDITLAQLVTKVNSVFSALNNIC